MGNSRVLGFFDQYVQQSNVVVGVTLGTVATNLLTLRGDLRVRSTTSTNSGCQTNTMDQEHRSFRGLLAFDTLVVELFANSIFGRPPRFKRILVRLQAAQPSNAAVVLEAHIVNNPHDPETS